ncbi:hypothetical protein HUW51_07910 [Adhaeribacter swui]|uniref:Uncharacterized protein n=1 Tax=Adhaeribacter swui TaxID=2086471 RepID=A0A7G7G672_9BACT|nr:hypothetical protein [Adhaeribacter swui]QNF32656.1 hypothetical protein HUW51_07910 [Adhaeribacter swui]
MALASIKTDFHQLIDKIENEELLAAFYQLLMQRSQDQTGLLWNALTEEEKNEVLLADDESKDSSNWLTDLEVRQKHQQWLNK